ncbi:MAG TPA: hypothetical protein DCQ06_04705, partial [Myxococcales bacterium]|nr:hypothetical protein [Myxococcales bacterium]
MCLFKNRKWKLTALTLVCLSLTAVGCGDGTLDEDEDISVSTDATLDASLTDGLISDSTEQDATAPSDTQAGDDTGEPSDTSTSEDTGEDTGGDSAGACPGGPGCECSADADCTKGACLMDKDAKKTCAAPCASDDDCADDRVCQDQDGAKLCVPKGASICAPCKANSDCAYGDPTGACVDAADGQGLFCGTGCSQDSDCASDESCADVKDVDGNDVKQCVPAPGATCSCTGYGIATKAETICYAAGLPGCTATVQCLADGEAGAPAGGGLTTCNPAAPTDEACDGTDNDCDGEADEDGATLCDDKNDCTADSCGAGACENKPAAGDACDDGNACTQGTACTDTGTCEGTAVVCDDNNPCTDDSCDIAVGCTTTNNNGGCDDNNACTSGDTCALGLCSGATVTCDDNNACTVDACDIAVGCTTTNENDGTGCDDGSKCTKDDACTSGACGGTKVVCDDNNPCTIDACDIAVGCTTTNENDGTGCDDGSKCSKDDACIGGTCGGTKVVCNDNNPCTI